MASVVFEEQLVIPTIRNLREFRDWALSDEFPQRGRIDYINGRIEVDMSPEDLFTHGELKVQVSSSILSRVQQLDLGHVFSDSSRISTAEADLSCEPDVVVVCYESIDKGRVRWTPTASGQAGRFVEIEGGPDLVVEIVSDSTVQKDTERLPVAYFAAGVREYWLIDARREELVFQMLCRGDDAFQETQPDADGYRRSKVLDGTFSLERQRHRRGHWVYRLLWTR